LFWIIFQLLDGQNTMARYKFNFEGIFELDTEEGISLKPGDKFKVKGTIEAESSNFPDSEPKQAEIKQVVVEEIKAEEAIAILPLAEMVETAEPQNWNSANITLEQFGGKGYYKLLEEGLSFHGNVIESINPIFSAEDVGMSFCGLFAHNNPVQPNNDEYYPGILGSRYARIVELISATKIKLNFEFNAESDKGYVFFDNSLAFRLAVNAAKLSLNKTLELQSGKTYVIPEYETTDLRTDFYMISQAGSNLKIGLEDYFSWADKKEKKQAGALFDFGGNSVQIGFKNVNFIPPHRRVKAAQLFFASLFKSSPNKEQQFKVTVLNMDTTQEVTGKDSRYNQVGFGFGFMYSSELGNYVVGKGIRHRGPGFMDFKANFGGGLYAVFENVIADFRNEESFASPRIKVKGKLENNLFTITSGHTIYQIFTYDFGAGNVAHLLHFGRYTFMIDGKDAVINATQFKVRPFAKETVSLRVKNDKSVYAKKNEIHAGDTLIHQGQSYQVIEKTRTYVTEWMQGETDVRYAMELKLDRSLPVSTGFMDFEVRSVGESLNSGQEVEAYLIYKANYEFRTYPDTKFGNHEVLSSDPVGHLSYNHKEITLWAKNFKHLGFYRQSLSHVGKSNGYTLIFCEGFDGQFSPDEAVKNSGEMPTEAKRLIESLEAKI